MSSTPTTTNTLPPLTPKLQQVYDLRQEGKSVLEICSLLDRDRSTIQEYFRRIKSLGYNVETQKLRDRRFDQFKELMQESLDQKTIQQKMNLSRRQFGYYMTRYRKFKNLPPQFKLNDPEIVQKWTDLHLKQGRSFSYIADLHQTTKGRVAGAIHRYRKAKNEASQNHPHRPRSSR